jgi:hypothetical protein
MATKPAVASENPERSSRNVRDANGKGRTVSIVRTFLVSAKWNLRLNGGWIVAFNPTEGLEARRRFNSDREAIAEARRLAKFGASVRIDEETPLWLSSREIARRLLKKWRERLSPWRRSRPAMAIMPAYFPKTTFAGASSLSRHLAPPTAGLADDINGLTDSINDAGGTEQ